MSSFSEQFAETFVHAIEQKDRVTWGHGKRVAHYAVMIARHMTTSFSDFELEWLRLAALLHDVGKIGIEDPILKKCSALDETEQKIMRKHPDLGLEILASSEQTVEGYDRWVDGIRFHHERWDGRGYPQGLQGEQIPWMARVVAVADAYDALRSHRPYRRGISADKAYREVVVHSGTQFDPGVIDGFSRAVKNSCLP
ncbi:HD-GYP domain-containing protein [Bdellovibrionota bacterium FG-1]